MKCALVIANNLKQIMLTPESEEEKAALALITQDQDISLDIKEGIFYEGGTPPSMGYRVEECRGDYLRAFHDSKSIMLILRPKKKKKMPKLK